MFRGLINLKKLPRDYKTNEAFLQKVHDYSLKRYIEKVELMPYQAELIKLQQHIERYGKKVIILFAVSLLYQAMI